MKFNIYKIRNKTIVNLVSLILLIIIGLIDYYTGFEIAFSIFYLIPIFYVTILNGKTNGIIFAVIAAVVWYIVDTSQLQNYSTEAVTFWNALVRFGFFLLVAYLIAVIKEHRENLEIIIEERTSDLLIEIEEHKKSREELLNKSLQLRELAGKIDQIKEEENKKIAREIHDELGQYLTAINLEVMWLRKKFSKNEEILKKTDMINKMVNDTIKTVRKISSSLRPRLLDQLGILPAIESQAREFQQRTGIKCLIELPPDKDVKLNDTAASSVFRVIQEAFTNIARHSNAKKVELKISCNGDNNFYVSIKDDGVGIKKRTGVNGRNRTLGILGMQERANLMGGTLEIISSPASGTEIILQIPINNC